MRHDGRELFFINREGQLMAATVEATADGLQFGAPRELFDSRIVGGGSSALGFKPMYDVARDGQRVVMAITPEGATVSGITVILNWGAGREAQP